MIRGLSRRRPQDRCYSWVIRAYFLAQQPLQKPKVGLTINSMTCLLRSDKWVHIYITWWEINEGMAWKDHRTSRLFFFSLTLTFRPSDLSRKLIEAKVFLRYLRDYVWFFYMLVSFHGYDVITFENTQIVVIVTMIVWNKEFEKDICRS